MSTLVLMTDFMIIASSVRLFIGWLCFTSHQQRGHLETAPPFTLPLEGSEAQFLQYSHQESNPELFVLGTLKTDSILHLFVEV